MSIKSNSKKGVKDVQLFLKASKNITVQLPSYQKKLRAHLLAQHTRSRNPCPVLETIKDKMITVRAYISAKSVLAFISPILVASVLVGGVFAIQPPSSANTAQWLVLAAAKTVSHMSPDEIAAISDEYGKNLHGCLQEATASKTLRVLSIEQLHALVGTAPSVEHALAANTYLAYTNAVGHRIVIGLTGKHRPVYVLDIDAHITKPLPAVNSEYNAR